jgi:hypothetical protein
MDKEKIKHIFAFLHSADIKSGKCIVFTESELKAIKSFCFSPATSKAIKKKIKNSTKRNKSVKKKMTKTELKAMRIKNLAKARKARKSKSKK